MNHPVFPIIIPGARAPAGYPAYFWYNFWYSGYFA